MNSEKYIKDFFELSSPSEIQELEGFGDGYTFYIKRDDLLHEIISGNKFRKLKYVFQRAIQQKKNHIVTFGGAFSNHILAVAKACQLLGFKSSAFIRGDELNKNSNKILQLCDEFGMNLIFVSREKYNDKKKIYSEFFENNNETFFVDEGGKSAEGILGCKEIIYELNEKFDYIITAAGTGTTSAGLALACAEKFPKTITEIISVTNTHSEIFEMMKKNSSANNYTIHTNYNWGGYAKYNNILLSFCEKIKETYGLILDPIYTGKMVWAAKKLANEKYFKPNTKILLLHTGGTFLY